MSSYHDLDAVEPFVPCRQMAQQNTIVTHADFAAASPVEQLRFLAEQMAVHCPTSDRASRRASARTVWQWQDWLHATIAQLDPLPVRASDDDDELPF